MDHARIDTQAGGPETGWVTVVKAAAALTDSNDQIDASNVSRYLARFPEIPQRKVGKFRYVDLVVLRQHRAGNVLVSEKQASREIAPPKVNAVRAAAIEDDSDDDANNLVGSAVQQANLRLKNLQIRERELDIAEREGALIADVEVLALLSGTMEAFVAALEREEVSIATNHGREFASAFRKGRKNAQAVAAGKLLELAQKFLPDSLAGRVAEGPPAGEAAA
jgi:hypothetical protein